MTKRIITRVRLTPIRIYKALSGTGGNKSVIAKRLGCHYQALLKVLVKEGEDWDKVRLAIKREAETIGDIAEQTVRQAMEQRLDISVASTAARWHLDRKHADRGYGKKDHVKIDGGDPIQVNHTLIPIDKLDLPVDVKVQVFDAMKKYQDENKAPEMKRIN